MVVTARRTRTAAPVVAIVTVGLVLLLPQVGWATSVGAPTGPAYADDGACSIPWLTEGDAIVIEGVTIRAVVNTADYLGVEPADGVLLHEAVAVGSPTRSSTRLTFSPAVGALEVTADELVPLDGYASESYRIVGSPNSGPDVLDWTLTDENAQASGTFAPGITTLDVTYSPSVSPDTLFYGATVRFRIPKVGETCDVDDAPPTSDDDEDDVREEVPVPTAVPSGLGRPVGAPWAAAFAVALVLPALARTVTSRRPGRARR